MWYEFLCTQEQVAVGLLLEIRQSNHLCGPEGKIYQLASKG
jgi:hypothetical protein